MRTIIFRGRRVYNDKWVEGSLILMQKIFGEGYFIQEKSSIIAPFGVNPKTVGQFTGLSDKNGVKIFEGDILKDVYGDIYVANWKGVLICKNKHLACDIPHRIKSDYKVIGNIHDNP